jgi:hypothetical protein
MTTREPLTVHLPGLVVTEHELTVPLDHTRPAGDRLTVFAREVAAPDGRDRPFLVFLQGGPGSEAPRPTGSPTSPGTGEHVFPSTFTDSRALRPLREAADLLAEREWPVLYDAEVLASVDVPCAAAIYAEDAYVERAFSEETARLIPTMRPWLTNGYEHNGLRADGARILDRLVGLARGRTA